MNLHTIPADVRDFAIANKISLGRYGRGYAAQGHYYIRDQGPQPNILAVSKYATSNSAFVMMRCYLRKQKFTPTTKLPPIGAALVANADVFNELPTPTTLGLVEWIDQAITANAKIAALVMNPQLGHPTATNMERIGLLAVTVDDNLRKVLAHLQALGRLDRK